ncbi:MAG: aspartate aminotransferase family protein [Holophagales bacterium]|nr:aspartate aminotransferase family protein [Holophagales bacterium]
MDPSTRELLTNAARHAAEYLETLPNRPVGARETDVAATRERLAGPLPEEPVDAATVIDRLAAAADPGLVATAGPRFFGFVIGGSLPVALAADWLTSAWDQNAGLYILSPALSVCEETAGGWLRELFGLPPQTSVGFVTGCQAANFSALAAARHALLERHGWDVEARGLFGAPELEVVVGDEAHITIHTALQMLGLGRDRVRKVAVDGQGRMLPEALAATLASLAGRPTLVCAQAGNINTGACDPLSPIADACAAHDAWLHVDGAFGLWAAASPTHAHLVEGLGRADSWATDAHKWLNVPYDSGLVLCAHPNAHRAALTTSASYLIQSEGAERDPFEWTPEFSRRARGFAVYAALAALGRKGVAELVDRLSSHARRFAEILGRAPGVEVLNEVVLNQVLVRFAPPDGGDEAATDDWTRATVRRVQEDGTCWLSGTTWRGRAAMRISVCNWSTTEADVDRSAEAILVASAG